MPVTKSEGEPTTFDRTGSRPTTAPRSRFSRRGRTLLVAGPLVGVLLLLVISGGAPSSAASTTSAPAPHPFAGTSFSAPAHAAPRAAAIPAAPTPNAARSAATGSSLFPAPCFPITKFACVRDARQTSPDIIPTGSNHASSFEPNTSDDIHLLVLSQINLIWATTGVPTYGPDSPLAINVTGVLWNGDTWMSVQDNSMWNANNNTWYGVNAGLFKANSSYQYVYSLTIANKSQSGAGQFFPGETVTWWIELTQYSNVTGFVHTQSAPLTYRYRGAWAFSPHPGAAQYVGPNASTADLNIHWNPRTPNWNDSVNVSIATTLPDLANYNNALIGTATLHIQEFHLGTSVANATVRAFPIGQTQLPSGVTIQGNQSSNATIPATFTQVAGDTIKFWVVAQDSAAGQNDTIFLPVDTFVVNGNGSFLNGIFSDDVEVFSSPNPCVGQQNYSCNGVPPGQNLTLTVESKSVSTSLYNAEVVYRVRYPTLSETSTFLIELGRLNSTTFRGTIPGLPLNSSVNMTILALDYTFKLDQSSVYSYQMPSLTNYTTFLPQNETFFYVNVYDNATSSYVTGAEVQVRGPTPAVNTESFTQFGVAYPNVTGNGFIPLLVATGVQYNISVTSPQILEFGGGHTLSVRITATNPMIEHEPLARGPNYIVLAEGPNIYFWVNGTVSSLVYAPGAGASDSAGQGYLLAALFGVIAAALVAYSTWTWFDKIQKRRKAEERRVTL